MMTLLLLLLLLFADDATSDTFIQR